MNSKLSLNIIDEVSQLSKVIVGQANNFIKPDISDLYDPTLPIQTQWPKALEIE